MSSLSNGPRAQEADDRCYCEVRYKAFQAESSMPHDSAFLEKFQRPTDARNAVITGIPSNFVHDKPFKIADFKQVCENA